MMYGSRVAYLCFVFIGGLITSDLAAAKPPSDEDVRKALQVLRGKRQEFMSGQTGGRQREVRPGSKSKDLSGKERPRKSQSERDSTAAEEDTRQFSLPVIPGLGYLIGAICVLVLAMVVYRLLRGNVVVSDRSFRHRETSPVKTAADGLVAQGSGLYDLAQKAYRAGNFSEAAVLLHKASVQVVYEVVVKSHSRRMTNGQISILLGRNPAMQQSFVAIAQVAEGVVFAQRQVDSTKCNELFACYESGFLRSN